MHSILTHEHEEGTRRHLDINGWELHDLEASDDYLDGLSDSALLQVADAQQSDTNSQHSRTDAQHPDTGGQQPYTHAPLEAGDDHLAESGDSDYLEDLADSRLLKTVGRVPCEQLLNAEASRDDVINDVHPMFPKLSPNNPRIRRFKNSVSKAQHVPHVIPSRQTSPTCWASIDPVVDAW